MTAADLTTIPDEVLHWELRRRALVPRVHKIIERAAIVFGTTPAEILSRCRSSTPDAARLAAMTVARETLGLSFPVLATCFRRRNHSTVFKAVESCRERIGRDPAFARKVGAVLNHPS